MPKAYMNQPRSKTYWHLPRGYILTTGGTEKWKCQTPRKDVPTCRVLSSQGGAETLAGVRLT